MEDFATIITGNTFDNLLKTDDDITISGIKETDYTEYMKKPESLTLSTACKTELNDFAKYLGETLAALDSNVD